MANMDPMQQEALKRAQEMQSRAYQQNQNRRPNANEQTAQQKNNHANRNYGGFSPQHSGNSSGQNNFAQGSKEKSNKSQNTFIPGKKSPPNEEASAQREKPQISNSAGNSRENKNMLDILMEDKERSLILLLILILSSEGTNQSLILALMYLII